MSEPCSTSTNHKGNYHEVDDEQEPEECKRP